MNYEKAFDFVADMFEIAGDSADLSGTLDEDIDMLYSHIICEKSMAYAYYMKEYIDLQYLYECMIEEDDAQYVGQIFKQRIVFIDERTQNILEATRKWKIVDRRFQKLMDRLEKCCLDWKSFIEDERPDLDEIPDLEEALDDD